MVLFCCSFCGDYLFSLSHYCNNCSEIRRMLLLSNKMKFINLLKNNLTDLVNRTEETPLPPAPPPSPVASVPTPKLEINKTYAAATKATSLSPV